jgi:EAL domain-containing protein (putative c-di-GMP-specific phosphodiesterase class I)/GGDEF domain-containing protein
VNPAPDRGSTWRGWASQTDAGSTPVTSVALSSDAPVRNRLFPKTRSWFALGAPLELLSPLSILRIIFAVSGFGWLIEALVLRWPLANIAYVMTAAAVAVVVWCALRVVQTVSRRWCHALAFLESALVLLLVHSGRSLGAALASLFFVVPAATFIALFLGSRSLSIHHLWFSIAQWVVLVGRLHAGGAALVAALVTVSVSFGTVVIRILVASVWRSGAIDPDTGLPNGVGLAQRLRMDRTGNPRALIIATVQLVGVDDARQALGHHVGTELLRRAVEDLGQVVPANSLLARVEGDEVVVARELDFGNKFDPSESAPPEIVLAGQALARELIATIASGRYLVNGVEVSLRAHVGLVFGPWDGSEVAELVRRSSLNARHGARVGLATVVWDGDHDALTGEDLALLAELRLAPERGELWLAYQPQVGASTNMLVSVEALLRWDSPTYGSVSPGRFIVLAERTGLIDRLTDWVLHEALNAQVRWRARGLEVPVSVNISAKTLSRPDLASWIIHELEEHRLPSRALTVEVTETAAADLLAAVHLLSPLHDRGIRVSIDDFGSGYTSLAAIPHLPLDEIKVDMEFVKRSLTSPADEAIVRCVQELSHRLGLVTVAEGVENDEIRDLMVAIGFDLLQGHFFSPGLSEPELTKVFEQPESRSPRALRSDIRVPAIASRPPLTARG